MAARMFIWPRYALEVDGKRIVFPGIAGAAIALLYQANGEYVETPDLIDAAYFDDPEGGPLCADECVKVAFCKARRLLSKMSVTLEGRRGRGGYRLILP